MKQTTIIVAVGLAIVIAIVILVYVRITEKYTSHYLLNAAYNNTHALHLPPVYNFRDDDTSDNTENTSVVPEESGMTIQRSAYKVGMVPQKFKGSYGVGYTDERGIC